MNKKKSHYWPTFGLNVLFIVLVPLILTMVFSDSMIAFAVYLLAYSALEVIIDAATYNNLDPKSPLKLYIATIMFNFILIYGVSLLLEVFLYNNNLFLLMILITMWVLGMSKAEIELDKKLIKRSR